MYTDTYITALGSFFILLFTTNNKMNNSHYYVYMLCLINFKIQFRNMCLSSHPPPHLLKLIFAIVFVLLHIMSGHIRTFILGFKLHLCTNNNLFLCPIFHE